MWGAENEDGRTPLYRPLESVTDRRWDGIAAGERRVTEIKRHQGKARAAREEIRSPKSPSEPPAAFHPEQAGEIRTRRGSRDRIERIRPVHKSDPAT
jgi:hypothetical protein